jgi:hypothetical protein
MRIKILRKMTYGMAQNKMVQPGTTSRREDTAGKKLKREICGKIEETGVLLSINLYKWKEC